MALPDPAWVADFCDSYAPVAFNIGKWSMIAGLVLGAVLAIFAAVTTVVMPSAAKTATANSGAGPVLTALKGLIEALSNAPPWIALFGGGLALFWIAGTVQPDMCKTDRQLRAETAASSGATSRPKTPPTPSPTPAPSK